MTDNLEEQLRRLPLPEPSPDLDQRIAALLASRPAVATDFSRRPVGRLRQQLALAAGLAACTVAGFAGGWWTAESRRGPLENPAELAGSFDSPIHPAETGEMKPAAGPVLESTKDSGRLKEPESLMDRPSGPTTTVASVTTRPEPRTRILDQHVFIGSDGQLTRAYLTATKRRAWRFDSRTNTWMVDEVSIPRVVVALPSGI